MRLCCVLLIIPILVADGANRPGEPQRSAYGRPSSNSDSPLPHVPVYGSRPSYGSPPRDFSTRQDDNNSPEDTGDDEASPETDDEDTSPEEDDEFTDLEGDDSPPPLPSRPQVIKPHPPVYNKPSSRPTPTLSRPKPPRMTAEDSSLEDDDEFPEDDDSPPPIPSRPSAYGPRPQVNGPSPPVYGKPSARPTPTAPRPKPPRIVLSTPTPPTRSCWWTGCQANDWAVVGCAQYDRDETNRRPCKDGMEYECCEPIRSGGAADEECWWSACTAANSSTFACPKGMRQQGMADCGEGDAMLQCCGKFPQPEEGEGNELTGESYEDLIKELLIENDDFTITPEPLPCVQIDPGKKHMLRVKNQGIRICDLCPSLPQKHLHNVYLDRVPSATKSNIKFPECFGLCLEEKTCMALSYDDQAATCYLFDSTAGGFVEDAGWSTVIMTQPTGVLQDWTYTRHTRLLGITSHSSLQPSFLHCLNDCNARKDCNYASYVISSRNCSLFDEQDDIIYVDLVYGYLAGVRVSHGASSQPAEQRFVLEGDELALPKVEAVENTKCKSPKNGKLGAYFSQSCLVSGSDMVGCDQATGCKTCYYPERTSAREKYSICPDSTSLRLGALKSSIISKMESCLADSTCIGVGFDSVQDEISPMSLQEYIGRSYNTRYLLKTPPDDSRRYLRFMDLVPNADISTISLDKLEFEQLQGKSFQQCISEFSKRKLFTVMSYSHQTKVCKMGTERSSFKRDLKGERVAAFKRPSLLSPVLRFMRTPGYTITNGRPRVANERCRGQCEETCSRKCSTELGAWCAYISIRLLPNGAECSYYDDDSDFKFDADVNSLILTKISSLDFSLEGINKLSSFQSSDFYNCFSKQNQQTQTSLSLYIKQENSQVARIRSRRNAFTDFFKGVGEVIVDTVTAPVKFVVDTGKNLVDTASNLIKGDLDAAADSFVKIPVVDLAKNTAELTGAVITGDLDTALEKGKNILENSALDVATSIALPGAGKVLTTGAKAGLKATAKQGVKNLKNVFKGGVNKMDDLVKNSRKIKNGKKSGKGKKKNNKKDSDKDKTNERKKRETEVEKERGEKCKQKSRTRRAIKKQNPPKKRFKPGDCDKDKQKGKCMKPKVRYAIASTLANCNLKSPGDKCRYECKPGYTENKPEATCFERTVAGKQKYLWEPKPTCDLKVCPAGDTPLLVLQTPQVKTLGSTLPLGDFITAYVVLFDKTRKLPIWSVALHQSTALSNDLNGFNYNSALEVKRLDDFANYPCKALAGKQTVNADYKSAGWHRGHLTPANVTRWSEKSKRISNLYINAAPQDGYSNSVPWSKLEAHVYCFSKRVRTIVATGICSSSLKQTMKGIKIPTCFWKMACYRDENDKYQVVGFYSSNSPVSTDKEKEARDKEILTPLSQSELKDKIKSGFNEVWVRPARHLNQGRPIALGGDGGVWFPVNILQCRDVKDLSDEEKQAWSDAFSKTDNKLMRGKNEGPFGSKDDKKKDGKDGKDDKKPKAGSASPKPAKRPASPPRRGGRRKRQATSGLSRGCHGSELKQALDLNGFFRPYVEPGDSDDEDDEDDDEGEDDSEESEDEEEGGKGDEGDGSVQVSVQKCGKRIVGYYTSWDNETIAGRELQRLTHVIYAFLETREDGSISIGSADRKNSADVQKETEKARRRLENLLDSAKRYPHVKIMFAVGGWENSQYFSAIAASPNKRLTFIASVVRMIEKFGFDGVDVDWEYPVTGGANEGVPSDKQNYVVLMKEMRTALDALAGRVGRKAKFLISFAGAAGQWTLDPGYDLPGLLKYADFVNIMTYDYFGAWGSKWGAYTGPPSPLYFGMPVGFSGKTNADWTVKYYTCKTKQPHKINMGVPFYGRYWNNVGASVDGKDEMWRTAKSVNGKFEGGSVPWYELKSKYLSNPAFKKGFHDKAKTPYAWNAAEKTYLGYEDKKSLEHKVKYAVDKNVGGLMIWALELDDDDLTLLDTVAKAPLCQRTDPKEVNHKCSPIDEKRWWTPEDGAGKEGLCGRSAPLYKGYYPVCDPDDPGYSCCGATGYCGSGPKFCDCPTCKNYRDDPKTILEKPIKPSIPVTWYLLNDADGKRGRCGRKIPKIGSVYPTCNPDDPNSYCCSNGGYCGNTDAHCKCDGCIDFKKNPRYKFGPKKWWTLEDGEDLGGRCGPKAPKVDGIYEAECEGTSKFHCCSPDGWCGSTPDFCTCKGCKDFKK